VTPRSDFIAFYEGHRRAVLGALAFYLGNRATAEELTQEAFIRVATHWERVRALNQPEAWVHRVAFNLANSYVRRRLAERRAYQRLGEPGETTQHQIDNDAKLVVREALSRLSRRERQAIVLRYYADLSVYDAAEAMKCPEGTVKTLVRRGLEKLQRDLGSAMEEEKENVR
jgi:RNA polymerase sigma-70 factor (sigma-E family)